MAATKKLLSRRVGEGGVKHGSDVKNLQDLLLAAGQPVEGGADGDWGDKTKNALEAYQKKCNRLSISVRPYVEPEDLVLMCMAGDANILVPLFGGQRTLGCSKLQQWFENKRIKYNAGAERGEGNRAIYGVEGWTQYAVQTTDGRFKRGPVEMDCTTYVNLMLSVFLQGHAHSSPYDASCKDFGGTSAQHCARDRYNFPLVRRVEDGKTYNFFKTAEQIKQATRLHHDKLFVMEVGRGSAGAVKHMSLLYNDVAYECTTGQPQHACVGRSLETFMENKSDAIIYLFGPR